MIDWTQKSSIASALFKMLNEIVSAICLTLSEQPKESGKGCETVITADLSKFPTRTTADVAPNPDHCVISILTGFSACLLSKAIMCPFACEVI